ncbi:MAG: YraN family protein [bacterium]|nr:YraN family protein [bacterium]
MTNTYNTGKLGEDLSCEYLIDKNYKILARNFRKTYGELDVIAKSKDKTLVFVEVKTIKLYSTADINNATISPEDNLTKAKLKKLQKIAVMFAGKHSELFDDDKGWRIDLIAITLFSSGERPLITHYENI